MSFYNTFTAALTVVNPALVTRFEYATNIFKHGRHKADLIQFGYDSANPGRSRALQGNQFNAASSENFRNRMDAIKIMWEARDLRQNSTLMNTILDKMALYVCGIVKYQAATTDKAVNAKYDAFIKKWARKCDTTKRHSFAKCVQMAFTSMLTDGDFGVITAKVEKKDDEGNGMDIDEYALQLVEADRIGDPAQATVNDPQIIRGVKRDQHGAPIEYIIYKRDENASYSDPTPVPAANFIHLFDPQRPDQVRGVSKFAQSIPHFRDIYNLYRAEMLAKQLSTNIAGIITGANGKSGNNRNGLEVKQDEQGRSMFKPEPGSIYYSEGEQFKMFESNRPDATWMGFIEALIREIAGSLGLPYEFVWNMASLGGATARVVLMQAHRCFQRYQKLLEEDLIIPVITRVINLGVANGEIPGHPEQEEFKVIFPPQITADVGYQTAADAQMVSMGWKTGAEVVAETGGDIERTTYQNAREAKMAQDAAADIGVPVELFAGGRWPNATAQLAAFEEAKKPGVPPPPPQPGETGLVSVAGDKSVDSLLQVMKSVEDGTLSRDSAIALVMIGYGMPYAAAEALVPDEPVLVPTPLTNANPRSVTPAKPGAKRTEPDAPKKPAAPAKPATKKFSSRGKKPINLFARTQRVIALSS